MNLVIIYTKFYIYIYIYIYKSEFSPFILNKNVTKHTNITISSLKQIKIISSIHGHHY